MTTAPSSSGGGTGRRSTGHRSKHTTSPASGKFKLYPGMTPFPKQTRKQFLRYVRTHRSTTRRGLALNGITEEAMQLGRTRPYGRHEKPRLIIDHYLDTSALPAPPAFVDRASDVPSWPMYGNDTIGDCTCAAAGHEIQAFTAYGEGEVVISQADVIKAYSAVSGYNPVTGANDNGANVQDVLGYWQKTGIGGHKIDGFAQLTGLDNLVLAKQCLDIFDTVYLGINVPQSAMDQFDAGEPWSFVGDTNIIGGHAIPVQWWGTDMTGEIEVVTWAKRQQMTREFWVKYVEEAWVVFSNDSLNAKGQTIAGFDRDQLRADFTDLTGQPASF